MVLIAYIIDLSTRQFYSDLDIVFFHTQNHSGLLFKYDLGEKKKRQELVKAKFVNNALVTDITQVFSYLLSVLSAHFFS